MRTPYVSPVIFERVPTAGDAVHLEVRIARTGAVIGGIAWHVDWRQYAFVPMPGGQYTRSVLSAVNRKLYRLMYDWRKAHPAPLRGQPPQVVKAAQRQRPGVEVALDDQMRAVLAAREKSTL